MYKILERGNKMKIYNYNFAGEFTGEGIADESPLENGIYLIPNNATKIKPPEKIEGKIRVFNNQEWIYKNIEEPVIESSQSQEPTVRNEKQYIQQKLEELDKKSVRDAEDLCDVLIAKGIITTTDIPYIAERKEQKRILRQQLKEG